MTTAPHLHGRYTSRPRAAARFVAQRLLLKPVAWSTVKVTVRGRENLKDLTVPFVAVANHSSHLDAPMVMCGLPWRLAKNLSTGVAMDYFFDVWWRRGLTTLFFNAFPIARQATDADGEPRRGASAKGLMNRGVSLLIFPEATRGTESGRTVRPFNAGAAAIASATDTPLLPVALIGTGMAFPKGASWPAPGRLPVGIVFGEPMRAHPGESAAAFMERVRRTIVGMIRQYSPEILGEQQLLDDEEPGPAARGRKEKR